MPLVLIDPLSTSYTPAVGFPYTTPSATITLTSPPTVTDYLIRFCLNLGQLRVDAGEGPGVISASIAGFMRTVASGAPTNLASSGKFYDISLPDLVVGPADNGVMVPTTLTPADGSTQSFTLSVRDELRSSVLDVIDTASGDSLAYQITGRGTGTIDIEVPSLIAAHTTDALVWDADSATHAVGAQMGQFIFSAQASTSALNTGTYNIYVLPYFTAVTGTFSASSVQVFKPHGFIRWGNVGTYEVGDF